MLSGMKFFQRWLPYSLVVPLLLTGGFAAALGVADLAGKYRLKGPIETEGTLILQSDQDYTASFKDGSGEWTEAGAWKIQGEELVLGEGHRLAKTPERGQLILPSGTRFTFREQILTSTKPGRKLIFSGPEKIQGD